MTNDNTPKLETPALARAMAINDLVGYFHGKSTANGWWSEADKANPMVAPAKLMLIVSEISEAMEGHRKNLMDDKLCHRKMIEVELGDALIRICDLAGHLGLDLGGATMEKDAFNDVRADHKPEARKAAGGKGVLMESMVERVALALQAVDDDMNNPMELTDAEARQLARAAIEAMRVPTDAMVDAGAHALIGEAYVDHDNAQVEDGAELLCFSAMIDAALNEQVSL